MNNVWQTLLPVRDNLVVAIGLLLAFGMSIHILLNKRAVASAVGWIGLVWFAPILGTISYFILGVNRVKRRARRIRPPGNDQGTPSARPQPSTGGTLEALERGISRITGRPALAGTTVQTYQNGDEAFPPMLAAIAAAKVSVGMSSYIFRDDRWGGRFIEALAEANARGVAVRVLIDGIGGGWIWSPAYHRLRRKGVAADRFLHSLLPWRMPFLNLRSHKKVLLIDGVVGFTGGMNIADENVMAARSKAPVQDVHFRVEGPVVSQLAEAFAADWSFATDEELTGDEWMPPIPPRAGPPGRVIDSGPDEDLEKVEFAVLQAVGCARTSIAVMTPYFLPDERLIAALGLAAMRGVSVDVVVPEKSDHLFVDWALKANIGPLLSDGVRIWESPSPFHHTKVMLVDDEWCLVGSCNWDIRSFRLNFELCMEIYDRNFAADLKAILDRARGPELTQAELDARGWLVRVRDAAARLMLPYL